MASVKVQHQTGEGRGAGRNRSEVPVGRGERLKGRAIVAAGRAAGLDLTSQEEGTGGHRTEGSGPVGDPRAHAALGLVASTPP